MIRYDGANRFVQVTYARMYECDSTGVSCTLGSKRKMKKTEIG